MNPETPSPGVHEPPRGAHAMNLARRVLLGILIVVAAVSVGRYVWVAARGGAHTAASTAAYYCPMHPSYTSPRPGECPICGMDLEPIPAGADSASASGMTGLADVEIDPLRIQQIGVRVAAVERRALAETVDLTGFVAPDESRLRRVQVRAPAWIEEVHIGGAGEWVRRGQPLATLVSPEWQQSEQEYLIELSGDAHGDHERDALGAARRRLELLGVPAEEVARLERERTATSRVLLRSPVSGTVIERGVTAGQSAGPETPLFTLADLSRVWVLADLYALDFGRIEPGDPARFTTSDGAGRSYRGRVDLIAPTLSLETRTARVRIILDNDDQALRPGMFGRVRIEGAGHSALVVPFDAVVRAGERDYAFVSRGRGRFQPRPVTVGRQSGDWVEIREGLAVGDTVVTSASFLIDSESRLKAALQGFSAPPAAGGAGH